MTIIADSDYVKNDLNKLSRNTYRKHDADFSGMVLYFTPKGTYLEGYAYQNGHLVIPVDNQRVINQQIQSLGGNLKPDKMVQQCTDYYIVYFTDGVYTSDEYLTTLCVSFDDGTGNGSNGAPPPPPPPCKPPPPTSIDSAPGGHLIVNSLPLPPDPGDGGMPPPSSNPCPPEVKTDTVTSTVNPCVQKAAVKSKAANAILAAINAAILADSVSSNEYGANQNLTSITGNTYKNTPVTHGTGGTWVPSFTWDSNAGYTVGWTHDHPAGSAPSPDDVFVMMDNLTNPLLISAGAASIKAYKSNVSVTIITTTGNYVVTVKDWGALQALFANFNSTPEDPTTHLNAFDADFVKKGLDYLAANPTASDGDLGLYALQIKFGGSINIFRAPKGSTTYIPVTLITVDGKQKVGDLQCP